MLTCWHRSYKRGMLSPIACWHVGTARIPTLVEIIQFFVFVSFFLAKTFQLFPRHSFVSPNSVNVFCLWKLAVRWRWRWRGPGRRRRIEGGGGGGVWMTTFDEEDFFLLDVLFFLSLKMLRSLESRGRKRPFILPLPLPLPHRGPFLSR